MSRLNRLTLVSLLAAAVYLGLPCAAEDEAESQVDRIVRSGVACVFNDLDCIPTAEDSGEDVYLTDENGDPVLDDEGNAVSNPDEAAGILGENSPGGPGARPGVGATTNLDFVPGESAIVAADFSEDNLGDFPRRFELIEGSFDVIEWQGERYVRAISGGLFAIPLPETLPRKFTLETSVSVQHGNGYLRIMPGRAFQGPDQSYRDNTISVLLSSAGLESPFRGPPEAMTRHDRRIVSEAVAPLRVMADGEHMKVYLGDRRVANVPNAVFPRTDTLFVAVGWAYEDRPILMGPIRIAGSEVELYDRLSRDGRVTARGILFDVNSDAIRIESAPTLEDIGTMLQDHPDLRISIEGHTDSDGDEAFNQELSERRAASVKDYLVGTYGIDPSRLETAGFGESVPVAPNDTREGKQQNRRVELVRL